MKAKAVIQNGAHTQLGGADGGIDERLLLLEEKPVGILHDQNCVFGRQSDEHHQRDLHVDVVDEERVEQMSEPQQHKGAQHGRRHSQQNSRPEGPSSRKAPPEPGRRSPATRGKPATNSSIRCSRRATFRSTLHPRRRQHLAGHLHDGLHRLLRRYAVGRVRCSGRSSGKG